MHKKRNQECLYSLSFRHCRPGGSSSNKPGCLGEGSLRPRGRATLSLLTGVEFSSAQRRACIDFAPPLRPHARQRHAARGFRAETAHSSGAGSRRRTQPSGPNGTIDPKAARATARSGGAALPPQESTRCLRGAGSMRRPARPRRLSFFMSPSRSCQQHVPSGFSDLGYGWGAGLDAHPPRERNPSAAYYVFSVAQPKRAAPRQMSRRRSPGRSVDALPTLGCATTALRFQSTFADLRVYPRPCIAISIPRSAGRLNSIRGSGPGEIHRYTTSPVALRLRWIRLRLSTAVWIKKSSHVLNRRSRGHH